MNPEDSSGSVEPVAGVKVVDDLPPVASQAVSVVIPAYNEEAHVAGQVEAVQEILRKTDWTFEILVVDDGSSDGTGAAAAKDGVRVIRHRQNRGYGAALKTGVAEATYPWILITDADGTYPPEAIPEILDRSVDCEMVIGVRDGEKTSVPLVRRPAKWFLGCLASYLAGKKLPDLNSGLRLMRKELIEAYKPLLPEGFSFTTTITVAAACNRHDVNHVSIDYHARLGQSKIRPRHAYDFLLLILRTMVFFDPLKVFMPLGAVLAAAGIAKLIYDLTLSNLSESAVLGLLGALVIWSMGLLADLNVRLLKDRAKR
ncbi:MAG: glycosyltransferase family 2 protein [Planctomycetota bacterium]|jgi:glycosyltransferase involved in cell wall biosynthesis